MNRSEIEKHKYETVELTYSVRVMMPGIVIDEDGISHNVDVRKRVLHRRVGVIANTTAKKVVLLLDDDDDDFEIYITYEDITKIRKVREYESSLDV
jgi:hypothetical protein